MMNHDTELKLQAYVDGELPAQEADRVAKSLAADPSAQALQTELRNIKAALAANELDLKLPESREFYWSKIAREIQRAEREQTSNARPTGASWWLRWAAPFAGLAALVVLLVGADKLSLFSQPDVARLGVGHEIESSLEESSASITFRSEKAAMTVVWVQDRENF